MKLITKSVRNLDADTYDQARMLSIKLKVTIGQLVTEGLKKIIKENKD